MEDEVDTFCPALPPHLMTKKINNLESSASSELVESKSKSTEISGRRSPNTDDESDMYCPALPPNLKNKDSAKDKVIGPSISSSIKYISADGKHSHRSLPENDSESDENEDIGPVPEGSVDNRYNEEEILRALLLKDMKEREDKKKLARESWMLELPDDKPNLAALGLGTRKFRKTAVESGDRSVWTDTPVEKDKKSKLISPSKDKGVIEDTVEAATSKQRDEEISVMVRKYNDTKRSTPLIDSHGKKRVREESSKEHVRKPFSREEDLSVHKFDEAQKAAILKKAKRLDDRFSSGKQKFL